MGDEPRKKKKKKKKKKDKHDGSFDDGDPDLLGPMLHSHSMPSDSGGKGVKPPSSESTGVPLLSGDSDPLAAVGLSDDRPRVKAGIRLEPLDPKGLSNLPIPLSSSLSVLHCRSSTPGATQGVSFFIYCAARLGSPRRGVQAAFAGSCGAEQGAALCGARCGCGLPCSRLCSVGRAAVFTISFSFSPTSSWTRRTQAGFARPEATPFFGTTWSASSTGTTLLDFKQ